MYLVNDWPIYLVNNCHCMFLVKKTAMMYFVNIVTEGAILHKFNVYARIKTCSCKMMRISDITWYTSFFLS